MKRISGLRSFQNKEGFFGPLLKISMIPYAVRLAAAAVSPLISRLNASDSNIGPVKFSGRDSNLLRFSGASKTDECGTCKHLGSISTEAQLIAIDQSSPVYQLIPPGPLITLKNGFVLSGFGRLRSMERRIPTKEESLRA
ncbi:MAG: hypothetical protein K2X77_06515 [Candidatus Obscuribacterales bacterium]|jgi:hypothetical protein|nr:hypothetical protein [Candidatus Obscuribacterales bacterium]